MPDPTEIQTWARTYGPTLDTLQAALEDHIGPLIWDPRTDPMPTSCHDGSTVTRVGIIHGIGVPLARLDPATVSTTVNTVLIGGGFGDQPPMTGSRSGHLVCEAFDPFGTQLTVLIKDAVTAWADVPS